MITKKDVLTGIYGAWRLLLADPRAASLFENSTTGFWKSFFAAILVLPIYFLIISVEMIPFDTDRSLPVILILKLEFYIIGWIVWPLAVGHALPALKRSEKFVLYIVAYNWANAVGAWIFGFIILITKLVQINDELVGITAGLASIGLLVYHVFITRTILEVPVLTAICFIICEFILGQFILISQSAVLT